MHARTHAIYSPFQKKGLQGFRPYVAFTYWLAGGIRGKCKRKPCKSFFGITVQTCDVVTRDVGYCPM